MERMVKSFHAQRGKGAGGGGGRPGSKKGIVHKSKSRAKRVK